MSNNRAIRASRPRAKKDAGIAFLRKGPACSAHFPGWNARAARTFQRTTINRAAPYRGTFLAQYHAEESEIMTFLEVVVYLVIAGVCGAVARAFAGGSRRGFVISLLVGFLGALVGTWLARQLHLPAIFVVTIGHPFPIVWSIIGGVVLVALAHMMMRPRFAHRY
jgi:uncharacterized membrane protein YeaQ/YmgE (transglycosylase-associated protein family)